MSTTAELRPHNTHEKKLHNWLRDKVKGKGHLQRIENTTTSGVPDVNFCRNGRDAWIELKIDTGKGVLLRKEQYAWILRRSMEGGNVVVLAKVLATNEVTILRPPFEAVSMYSKYIRISHECATRFDPKISCETLFGLLFE